MMDSLRGSLKKECLSVIVENFERYYSAFKLPHGSVLEKQFQYLERAFSETLLHRLINCGKLKKEYFELLINPHVHQLNLQYIDEELIPALLDQLQTVETNIAFLKAGFWNVKLDQYKQLVSSVPYVEVIELSDVVHPEVLEEIGKRCPLLRVLKIMNCDVNDFGLMNIFMNVNGEYEDKVHLEQLDISTTMVTNVGVSFVLSHAPFLKCLEYINVPEALYEKHKNDMENNCIEESKKYSLTSLSFPWQVNMLDTLKICVALCPNISSLSIDHLENADQLLLCSKFHHLKDIKLFVEANSFSLESITQFLKLRGRGLFSFHLENGCMSAEALVEHCPKLRSLKLGAVHYKPLDPNKYLFSKAKLPCLKTLAITNSNFSVKETADSMKLILSNSKGINSVNFSGAEGLTENFVRSILHLGMFQVHELNLNSSDVTVPPIVELLSHGSLQRLFVANCSNITKTEYFHLLDCKGDSDVVITLSDDESGSDSFDGHGVYGYSDREDDDYGLDYDDYAYNEYDAYVFDYDDYAYDEYDAYVFDFDDYVHDDDYAYNEYDDYDEFPVD